MRYQLAKFEGEDVERDNERVGFRRAFDRTVGHTVASRSNRGPLTYPLVEARHREGTGTERSR